MDSEATVAVPAPVVRTRSPLLVAAASVAIMAAIGYWLWSSRTSAPIAEATGTRPSVAVMYFENNTGNKDLDWLRTGLTDMLVTDLSQSPDVEVLSTDRLVQILGSMNKLEDRQISFDTVREVARRGGVKHVMLGSYIKAGDAIRINLKLQDAATGKIISTERVDAANESSLFPTVDDLTRKLKARFAVPNSGTLSSLFSKPGAPSLALDRDLKDVTTSSVEAYREYAAGVELHQRARYLDAFPHFQKATEIDPNFALAYLKWAVGSGNIGRSNDADKYAKRALELTDRLTPRERYYIEGYYYASRIEDTAKAMSAYSKAIELYPDHSASRTNLALLYLRIDQVDKCIEHYTFLRQRGFEFPGAAGNLAICHLAAGDRADALEVLKEYIERFPDVESGHLLLGLTQISLDHLDEAEPALKRANELRPAYPPAIVGQAHIATLRDDFTTAHRILAQGVKFPAVGGRSLTRIETANTFIYQARVKEALAVINDLIAEQGPEGSNESARARGRIAELLLAQHRTGDAVTEARRAATEARGRESLPDVLLIGSLAGDASARANLQRLADALPSGSIKALPLLADAAMAIEGGHVQDGAKLLTAYESKLLPGLVNGAALVPQYQPRAMLAYWRGRERLASGDYQAAIDSFSKNTNSVALHQFNPIEYVRGLYYTAQAYENSGDHATAREFYARFLKYWGNGELDRDKIAEARKKIGS
jgi:tetratricopeptide (TPR) repeat protein/TolB-like protein